MASMGCPAVPAPDQTLPGLVLTCATGFECWAAPSTALTMLFSPQQAGRDRSRAEPGTAAAVGAPHRHGDPPRTASSRHGNWDVIFSSQVQLNHLFLLGKNHSFKALIKPPRSSEGEGMHSPACSHPALVLCRSAEACQPFLGNGEGEWQGGFNQSKGSACAAVGTGLGERSSVARLQVRTGSAFSGCGTTVFLLAHFTVL